MQIIDIFNDRFRARHYCIGRICFCIAEKKVKDRFVARHALFKIAVHHGQLIKVRHHGQVAAAHYAHLWLNPFGGIYMVKTVRDTLNNSLFGNQ